VKKLGSYSLVLHAHLPYVLSHGTWPHGTDWLNEAAAETYIPLLNVFNRLKDEGISPKVTVGLTPVLTEMLASGEFKEEFKVYLNQKKVAAGNDIDEFTRIGEAHMAEVARMWLDFYGRCYTDFTERYGGDLVGAYRRLQDEGHIEIITSGATHGYFPLLSEDTSIQAQVKQGISSYRRHFGKDPVGIWLPECAYRPSYNWARPECGGETRKPYLRKGIEEFLSENGIKYFFIDSHLLKGGQAIGVYLDRFEDLKALWSRFEEQYKPLPEDTEKTPYKVYWVGAKVEGRGPVAVFTRDPKTGLQVWSGEWGYPGDRNYLDFHKKRFPGGLKYWKVTDVMADLADKGPYSPENAYARIPENAGHFKELIKENLRDHLESTGQQGIVVSPYDAELFGHWWFEGPEWIYHVIKYLYLDGGVRLTTAGGYLASIRPMEVITLPEGSWGEGGYHWIWLNDMNKWTWKHVYEAEEKMQELASRYGERKEDTELQDILKQAARELMLLESSDWQFLSSSSPHALRVITLRDAL
jgi:1,4-alpha-glucan branching enzyme